jgi:hypothetical protein
MFFYLLVRLWSSIMRWWGDNRPPSVGYKEWMKQQQEEAARHGASETSHQRKAPIITQSLEANAGGNGELQALHEALKARQAHQPTAPDATKHIVDPSLLIKGAEVLDAADAGALEAFNRTLVELMSELEKKGTPLDKEEFDALVLGGRAAIARKKALEGAGLLRDHRLND